MKLKNQKIQPLPIGTKIAIAAGVITTLGLLKMYFKGGVCRANRDMQGQVVVITGGNAGIGK